MWAASLAAPPLAPPSRLALVNDDDRDSDEDEDNDEEDEDDDEEEDEDSGALADDAVAGATGHRRAGGGG